MRSGVHSRSTRGCHLPVLFTILAGCVGLAAQAADSPIPFEHQTWRTENGLPQNSVRSIVQTSDGYIWLATEGGLARFDGLQFVVFDSENTAELRNNNIRFLLEDNEKALWIATADGLTRLQNAKFTLFTTRQGLPSNNVLSMLKDADGTLWAITTEGIAVYQNGRFSRRSSNAIGADRISAAAVDRNGNVWMGTGSGLLVYPAHDGRPQIVPAESGRTDVQVLLADRLDRLWIGTNNGLMVYENGHTKTFNLRPSLTSSNITALSEDRAGAIWVGTEAGAARITGGKLLSASEAISREFILSFLEDREGDMWIGTDSGGVTVLRERRFRIFGRDEGMPDDLVRCVFEDLQGSVWVGTDGHGLRRFNGRTFSSFTTANGLSSDVILSIAGDSHENLFVGTPDGLNIIHQNHVQWLTSADGLPDDLVRSIYEDQDGSLWMGTRRGLAHYAAGKVTTYTTVDGLPSDLVGAIMRGKDGCLWIATLKGVVSMSHGRITQPAFLRAMRDKPITSFFEDAEGVLWIGANEGGLARLAGQHTFEFPSTLGLPKTVSGIVEDSNGQLWITSPHGLFRVSRHELDRYADGKTKTVLVTSYGTADGLPVNEFSTGGHPTVWKDRRNTLWFASAKGVVSIDAPHTAPHRAAPSVVLESVIADDQTFNPSDAAAFGPALSRLSFEYAGLSFAAPQQVRFKYRMEDFDRTWIDAGTRRAAYYTNLPPGAYRFVVLARSEDGAWSGNNGFFSFQVRPRFYQTSWFPALLLFAVGAFAYLFYRWRVNLVRAQFHAVITERTRIAREIHDTLAQGFVAVSVQLELVQRLMATSLESAKEVLQEAQHLVQDSLAEARHSIWNLRAEPESDQDLPSKLAKAVRQSVQNHPLDVKIEVKGAYRPLPANIETEVLRIGQEAIMNVVRHANATHLNVSLAFFSTKAQMTIRDDGRGFIPHEYAAAEGRHFGLRGMRERAEGINAKLSVTTATGEGTQVCLELPLE
jgi:ligand-binding sensor domain-containing protein/signal transduction histidine kinase